jgi:hypothetical protein
LASERLVVWPAVIPAFAPKLRPGKLPFALAKFVFWLSLTQPSPQGEGFAGFAALWRAKSATFSPSNAEKGNLMGEGQDGTGNQGQKKHCNPGAGRLSFRHSLWIRFF